MSDRSLLQQYVRQFLVHSFLYYKLGESVIEDHRYDHICQELQRLVELNEDASIPHLKMVRELGKEASGFSIKKYPPEIISVAIHLLFQTHYSNKISFKDFVTRHGYRFES